MLELDIYATTDDGRTLHRLTEQVRPYRMTAAHGVATFAYIEPEGGLNGLAELKGIPPSMTSRQIPTMELMTGLPRVSRDGRKLGYVITTRSAGRIQDGAVLSSVDGRRRHIVARVPAAINMDFDARGRLRVLGDAKDGGSYITAPNSSRTATILRRRTKVIRYNTKGMVALSGIGWAEVRDSSGHIHAHSSRHLVVLSWSTDGKRVLVRDAKKNRLAWWNVQRQTLKYWPRLSCGVVYEAEQ